MQVYAQVVCSKQRTHETALLNVLTGLLTCRAVCTGDIAGLQVCMLSKYLNWGLNLLALIASQWPMHQVQVKIFSLKVLDSLLASLPDTSVVRVVQLAGDPHILSRNLDFLEDAGERLAHSIFVAVGRRSVDVSACMQ